MWNRGLSLLFALAVTISIRRANSHELRLGGALKIYPAYGKFNENLMAIIHPSDSDAWTFRKSIVNVFENVSATPRRANTHRTFSNRDIKLKFCRNVDDLMQHYFHNFKFEGVRQAWQALMSNWSENAIAGRFGINASYLNGNYSYIFLKIEKVCDHAKITGSPDDLVLKSDVAKLVENLSHGGVWDLVRLVIRTGSHYITSFTTGNVLYQLKNGGLSNLSSTDLSNYFSPEHAVQVGKILSASGNLTVEAQATELLRGPERKLPYASLTHLHNNITLHQQVSKIMHDEALLGLHLAFLSPMYKVPETRAWFQEYIDDYLGDVQSSSRSWRP